MGRAQLQVLYHLENWWGKETREDEDEKSHGHVAPQKRKQADGEAAESHRRGD